MTALIILLGVALVLSLAFNFGILGSSRRPAAAQVSAEGEKTPARLERGGDERGKKLEAELDKRKKELDDLKKAYGEAKDELKSAKKKLFDQKEAEKNVDDLTKARAEVERHASLQLEATRAELATALAELQRMKAAGEEARTRRRPVERTEEKPAERAPEKQEVVQRVIRELSDVEKERIARLEQQSSSDRKKANELDREVRALRGKIDRMHRESKRVYSDANLARDKFRAVEMRLNRTLLESDLARRALKDLEKKTGQHAEHSTLTPEEIAESDRRVKEKHAAEDRAEAEARARLEAALPTTGEESQVPGTTGADAAAATTQPSQPAVESGPVTAVESRPITVVESSQAPTTDPGLPTGSPPPSP